MSFRPALFIAATCCCLIASRLAAQDQSPGQADLDKATELKINATDLNELNQVIRLLDSALDKGLDADNTDFAEEMLVGSLTQRANALAAVLLKQAAPNLQRNPQYLQLRMMVLNDLQRIISLDDAQTDAHLLLGRLQSAPRPLGDPVAARDALTKVIEAQGVEPVKQAQAYALRSVTRSERENSIADLDEALKLDPDKAQYLMLRARQLHAAEEFEKAAEDVEKAMELAPDNPSVYQLQAIILMSQDKLDEALKSFDKATELAPNDIGSYQMRSQLFEQMGDPEKALEQIDKAIELQPDNLATRLLKVNLLIKSERYEDALADIDALLQKQPGFVQAKMIRTQLLDELGRDSEALAALEELAKQLPDQPEIQLQLAAHYMDNQQPTRAIAALTKVLELADGNQIALRLRGDMYLSVGKHAEALADFEKAYELNAEDSGLLNNFAWTLATSPFDELRDGQRAIEMATRACELTEYKAAHILSTLAAAYAESGDFESAVEWSTQAVELAQEGTENELLEPLQEELASYQAGKPWRELQQELDVDPLEDEPEDEPLEEGAAPARSIDF